MCYLLSLFLIFLCIEYVVVVEEGTEKKNKRVIMCLWYKKRTRLNEAKILRIMMWRKKKFQRLLEFCVNQPTRWSIKLLMLLIHWNRKRVITNGQYLINGYCFYSCYFFFLRKKITSIVENGQEAAQHFFYISQWISDDS